MNMGPKVNMKKECIRQSLRNFGWLSLLMAVLLLLHGCSDGSETDGTEPEPVTGEVEEVVRQLWSTSCLTTNATRNAAFAKIQGYADVCSAGYFESYLKSLDDKCESAEKYDNMLHFYRMSFDKVLDEVKSTQVEPGTSVIWMLYNMGYVVKTPSTCFAIDISHRWAKKLALYIDFLCITHEHSDHYNKELIQEMLNANKPVLSNYLRKGEGYNYTSTVPAAYTIGPVRITTNITDHNSTLTNFVTTFQFHCGADGGNLVLMHVGDSNYKASQYRMAEPVDVFIPRYAPNALTENDIIGKVVTPKYVLMSHILELAHAGVEESRWSIDMGLERAAKMNCAHSVLPFWGEQLLWKDGKLSAVLNKENG